MSTIKSIIDNLISNSTDAFSLNKLLSGNDDKHADDNPSADKDITNRPKKGRVRRKKHEKKHDSIKEFKINLDRFIMNLDSTDKEDLNDLIAIMTCYLDDEFPYNHCFNSTMVLIIRQLISFGYYIDIDSIIKMIEKISKNDKIKSNSIAEIIEYLMTYIDNATKDNMNTIIITIHSIMIGNNLWITEDTYLNIINLMIKYFEKGLHVDNIIITTVLTCVNTIIARYPYFEKVAIKATINSFVAKCDELKLVGLDINYDVMSDHLIKLVYDNVVTKIHRNSGLDELGQYGKYIDQMNIGQNLIIDGKNIFHNTSGKDQKYINFSGLIKFIGKEKDKKPIERTYNRIYVVFYCEHYKVLKDKLNDMIESSDHNSIKFCDHLYIILSPIKKNDDILTLHLWLSKHNNYLLTKDNFTDHAKSFHSNIYIYENWNYFYMNRLVKCY